jgi:hypothetical protein
MKKKFNSGLNSIIMALTQACYYGFKDKKMRVGVLLNIYELKTGNCIYEMDRRGRKGL